MNSLFKPDPEFTTCQYNLPVVNSGAHSWMVHIHELLQIEICCEMLAQYYKQVHPHDDKSMAAYLNKPKRSQKFLSISYPRAAFSCFRFNLKDKNYSLFTPDVTKMKPPLFARVCVDTCNKNLRGEGIFILWWIDTLQPRQIVTSLFGLRTS